MPCLVTSFKMPPNESKNADSHFQFFFATTRIFIELISRFEYMSYILVMYLQFYILNKNLNPQPCRVSELLTFLRQEKLYVK